MCALTASSLLLTALLAIQHASPASAKRLPARRQLLQQKTMPYLRTEDLHNFIPGDNDEVKERTLKENWMSTSEDVQFLPLLNHNANDDKRKRRAAAANKNNNNIRSLEQQDSSTTTGAHSDADPYSVQPFVSGLGDYDEYQQAWRLLGFMIDCNEVSEYNDDYVASNGSGDQGTEEGCARYLLWAAYVDLDYRGCGIGEYQYWDVENGIWDDSSCMYANGGKGDNGGDACSRCAKMDCHLEDTHFAVLGFFKHKNYDDWMEQLFKHQGMCVWSDEQYAFMKNARKAWPGGCVYTGKTNDAGSTLYYNVKPIQNGRIAVGMYTDEYCLEEYPVDTDEIESMLGNIFQGGGSGSRDNYNYDFSQDTFAESMERWNSAFSVWNTCHPCVAYDLENTDGTKYSSSCYDDDYAVYYDDQGNMNYYNNRNKKKDRKLGGEYCAEGDIFECYDDAGYTNVNQCMKFSAKTVMKTATFRDLSLGSIQGSLAEYPLSGFIDSSKKHRNRRFGNFLTWAFLVSVTCALCYSLWNLRKVSKEMKLMPTLRSSLLGDDGQGGGGGVGVSEVETGQQASTVHLRSSPPRARSSPPRANDAVEVNEDGSVAEPTSPTSPATNAILL